ncbi:MAG: integrase [Betaproteobacteria bacterium]|nr:integrase [Betaproteobacteria bacterium]
MRSLITNVLNEAGFNPDAVERQLDHKEPNKVRAAYLRSDFMEERTRMVQWFANWCDGDSSTASIYSLRSA